MMTLGVFPKVCCRVGRSVHKDRLGDKVGLDKRRWNQEYEDGKEWRGGKYKRGMTDLSW